MITQVRLLSVLAKHLVWHGNSAIASSPFAITSAPSTIFRPVRTRSYCSIAEIDINLHKSNSTFYADLDISRIELLVTLFKDAITPLSARTSLASESPYSRRNRRRPLIAALGGVTCLFRREIKPYQKYELVSRVLAWDEKWLFIVSYFLKPSSRNATEISEDRILASAISRYVFKKGRQTVQPLDILRDSGLVPSEIADNYDAVVADVTSVPPQRLPLPGRELTHRSAQPAEPDSWTWHHVEYERQIGLEVARHMGGLDGLMKLGA